MTSHSRLLVFAVCLPLLGGCASIGSTVSSLVVSTTTAGPTQAKTVGEAINATKLVEDGLDLYVTTGSPSKAVLDELNILVPALHNTLVAAEDAQRSGNSAALAAAMAAFNQALSAVQGYETKAGVPQQ